MPINPQNSPKLMLVISQRFQRARLANNPCHWLVSKLQTVSPAATSSDSVPASVLTGVKTSTVQCFRASLERRSGFGLKAGDAANHAELLTLNLNRLYIRARNIDVLAELFFQRLLDSLFGNRASNLDFL